TGEVLTRSDRFQADSTFYGAQVGGRAGWDDGCLSVSVLGKLALGCTQQTVGISGASSAVVNPGEARRAVPGGLLAQPSNIGRHFRSRFAAVPEVGLTAGWWLTDWLQFQAGYSLLYWSDVARPGEAIDREVNRFAVPTDPNFRLAAGPPQPAFIPGGT